MTRLTQLGITVFATCFVLAATSANAAKPKTIYSFTAGDNGFAPNSLIEVGHTFYGTAAGGQDNLGTVFQLDANQNTKGNLYLPGTGPRAVRW